jgi:hypothetical protein
MLSFVAHAPILRINRLMIEWKLEPNKRPIRLIIVVVQPPSGE